MWWKKKEWRPDVIVVFTRHTSIDSPKNLATSKRMEMLANIYRSVPIFFDQFHGISYVHDGIRIGGGMPTEGHYQGSLEFFALFVRQAQLARWKKVLLVVGPGESADLARPLRMKGFEVREDTYLKEMYPKKFWN